MERELVATFNPVNGENGKMGAVPAHPSQAFVNQGFVRRAGLADPGMIMPAATPMDFTELYPTPLDGTDVYAMCSETSLVQAIPEEFTGLKAYMWRETNHLAFASGTMSTYIGFPDGLCPEPMESSGENKSVTLKNIGVYQGLTISDILHSRAVAGSTVGLTAPNAVGPWPSFGGLPGTRDGLTEQREFIADIKDRKMREGMVLLLNGEDYLLAKGNATTNSLVFDGIETLVNAAAGAHVNTNTASGTFSASDFDRFLGESCASSDTIFGHPQALQEVMSAYFQLIFQGSQTISYNDGTRIVPGFNFASQLNTGVGTMRVVADSNFTRTNIGGGAFQSSLYALKTRLNGENIVVRKTQIPLALTDLAPGCTAVQFQIWKKTALVIKAMCAQNKYTSQFTGRIVTTCPTIG